MIKKVGIITINDYNNYGNRLQNYATQKILESIGCEVETIVTHTHNRKSMIEKIKYEAKRNSIKELFVVLLKKFRLKVYKTKKEIEFDQLSSNRISVFVQFTKENINESKYHINTNDSPLFLDKMYDHFVVGSDQVWNPNFRGYNPVDFLTFASASKRIALAPSFGISEIPTKYRDSYEKWIKGITHLSVREEMGRKIIKQLTNRDAVVILDPTLILDREDWLRLCEKSNDNNNVRSPYLLTYFLGDITEDKNEWISDIAKKEKLTIVNLLNIMDKKYYISGPIEFLNLIRNCSLFCTDSFHGVAFSIIFEKPFVVFDRVDGTQSMNSRLDTILTKFDLIDRKWDKMKFYDNYKNIDYMGIARILDAEKQKAINFLKISINSKEE